MIKMIEIELGVLIMMFITDFLLGALIGLKLAFWLVKRKEMKTNE